MTTPASWLAAVQARIDSTELIALSNVESETQDPTPAVDTDRVEACIDDAIGLFQIQSGLVPSLTDPSHVAAIVLGTKANLLLYKGQGDAGMAIRNMFLASCRDIRNIIIPAAGSTNSGANALTPSDQNPTGALVVRPDSDRENLRGYLPKLRYNRRYGV